jgi:ferric-dicitrate binding protein FerR (iron transport regulator)
MASKKSEKDTEKKTGRRGFLRAAAVGVAGVALTGSQAGAAGKTEQMKPAAPRGAQALTAAEQAKDVKLQDAARLLRDIDNNIEIKWVKGKAPAARRVIQMYG